MVKLKNDNKNSKENIKIIFKLKEPNKKDVIKNVIIYTNEIKLIYYDRIIINVDTSITSYDDIFKYIDYLRSGCMDITFTYNNRLYSIVRTYLLSMIFPKTAWDKTLEFSLKTAELYSY